MFAEFSEGDGLPGGGHRVQTYEQFSVGAGIDVAGLGEDFTGQDEGLIVGPGDGGGGFEYCDLDRVGE